MNYWARFCQLSFIFLLMFLTVFHTKVNANELPDREELNQEIHGHLSELSHDMHHNDGVTTKNLMVQGVLNMRSDDRLVSDIWVHGDYAYVGGFGFGTNVKVVDISQPRHPVVVAELQHPFYSSPQDVKVSSINIPSG